MFIHFLVTFCCIALSTRLPTIITEIITEIPNTLYNKIVLATSTVLVVAITVKMIYPSSLLMTAYT